MEIDWFSNSEMNHIIIITSDYGPPYATWVT